MYHNDNLLLISMAIKNKIKKLTCYYLTNVLILIETSHLPFPYVKTCSCIFRVLNNSLAKMYASIFYHDPSLLTGKRVLIH